MGGSDDGAAFDEKNGGKPISISLRLAVGPAYTREYQSANDARQVVSFSTRQSHEPTEASSGKKGNRRFVSVHGFTFYSAYPEQ
jgi:hypothetical protein